MGKKKWTEEQKKILTEHYYEKGPAILSRTLLKEKNRSAIWTQARRMGLKANPDLTWSLNVNREDLGHLIRVEKPFYAYMLGYLWADGHVSKARPQVSMRIVSKDWREIKEKWFESSKSWNDRVVNPNELNPNRQEVTDIVIQHQEFHAFLVQNGYLFKSGGSAIDIINAIPEQFRRFFWLGYFDGDGCFWFCRTVAQVTITSCKEQDWSFAEFLTKNCNIHYTIREKIHKGKLTASYLHIQSEANIRRFMDYIYQGADFGLKRKRKIYESYLTTKDSFKIGRNSKYKGVRLNKKTNIWCSHIRTKGKIYTKNFNNELDAAKHRDIMAKQFHGHKAILNFPNE